jgi:large subunit ribosomal protein L24
MCAANNRLHIKKDDMVEVITGREKGKRGKVLIVMSAKNRAIVEKINFIKRHTKPSQTTQQGGIIEREGALHTSNLKVVCQRCNEPVRIGRMRLQDGKGARYCKSCGELID